MTIITIDNEISINKDNLPDHLINDISGRLTLANPEYKQNQNAPENFYYLKQNWDNLIFPRGFINKLISILKNNNIPFEINDQTRELDDVDFCFKGTLHDYQQEAVAKIIKEDFSVLQSPPCSGRTVMALNVIAERKQPTLIIVSTKPLLYKWQERIEEFLDIPKDEIGLIGDGNNDIDAKITIAIANSLKKCAVDVKNKIGSLVVDECHKTPSKVFTEVVKVFDCRYMLGLSATSDRNDGLAKLIDFHVGDKVHDISAKKLQKANMIMTPTLQVRETDFDFHYHKNPPEMINNLIRDYIRNELIVNDVVCEIQDNGGVGLILSERKDHCETLYQMLKDKDIETRFLTGDMGKKERLEILAELSQGHIKALVVTSQLVGKGFELKHISSIFLCTPIKSTTKLADCIGCILRIEQGKDRAVIYDYRDRNVPVIDHSFKSRRYTYKEFGIKKIPNLLPESFTVGSGRM